MARMVLLRHSLYDSLQDWQIHLHCACTIIASSLPLDHYGIPFTCLLGVTRWIKIALQQKMHAMWDSCMFQLPAWAHVLRSIHLPSSILEYCTIRLAVQLYPLLDDPVKGLLAFAI